MLAPPRSTAGRPQSLPRGVGAFGSCGAEGQGLGSGAISTERGGIKGEKGGERFFVFLLKPGRILADIQSMEANLFLLLAAADAVGCACCAGTLWALPWGVLCMVCYGMGLSKAFSGK